MYKKFVLTFMAFLLLCNRPTEASLDVASENIKDQTLSAYLFRIGTSIAAAAFAALCGISAHQHYVAYCNDNRFKKLTDEEFSILCSALTTKLEAQIKPLSDLLNKLDACSISCNDISECISIEDEIIKQANELPLIHIKNNCLALKKEIGRRMAQNNLQTNEATLLYKLKMDLTQILHTITRAESFIKPANQENSATSLEIEDENNNIYGYDTTHYSFHNQWHTNHNQWHTKPFYTVQLWPTLEHEAPIANSTIETKPVVITTPAPALVDTTVNVHDILLSCYS